MTTQETWKDIPDYENLYQVSTLGRVRSAKTLKPLVPQISDRGYLRVRLTKNKQRKTARVHRLVAYAFIPNVDMKPEINHINGNKTDNRVCNLVWVSKSENQKHSYRVLNRKPSMLGKFGSDNPNSMKVVQLKNNKIVQFFSAAKEAERETGIPQGCISRCARGQSKTAGGFQWAYLK